MDIFESILRPYLVHDEYFVVIIAAIDIVVIWDTTTADTATVAVGSVATTITSSTNKRQLETKIVVANIQ